jgi:hypothetical protein
MSVLSDPYAPPAELPIEARARVRGGWIKWVYLGLHVFLLSSGIFSAVFYFAFLVTRDVGLHPEHRFAIEALAWLSRPVWIATFLLGALWIHAAFTSLPKKDRDVTPLAAAGRLFIPFYGVYWMFAVQLRLCRALDAARKRRGLAGEAPLALAVAAPIVTLIAPLASRPLPWFLAPLLATALPGALWFSYMRACDRSRAGLTRRKK